MKERFQKALEIKIDEMLFDVQNELGITDGQVDPIDAINLDELTEKLAEQLEKIIRFQERWNKDV